MELHEARPCRVQEDSRRPQGLMSKLIPNVALLIIGGRLPAATWLTCAALKHMAHQLQAFTALQTPYSLLFTARKICNGLHRMEN